MTRKDRIIIEVIVIVLLITIIFNGSVFWIFAGGVAQTIAVLFTFKALSQSEKSVLLSQQSLIQSEKSLKYVLMPLIRIHSENRGDDSPSNYQGSQSHIGKMTIKITNTGQGSANDIKIKVYKEVLHNNSTKNYVYKGVDFVLDDDSLFCNITSSEKYSLNKTEDIVCLYGQQDIDKTIYFFKEPDLNCLIVVSFLTNYALEPSKSIHIKVTKLANVVKTETEVFYD